MAIVLEKSEDGTLTLPAELLPGGPRARYSVERDGGHLVITPEAQDAAALSYDEWMREWSALAEKIGKAWPQGLSAVDAVNAIRR